ncbi:MAG: M24 family metallopeptidase [Candidatus Gracilibacteria bacterium]|jgi:hypothetical protein
MNSDQKIEICKKTREYAQESLFKVLQEILKNNLLLSEAEIRDRWIFELRKNNDIFKEGWYSPPPYGIGILIGTDEDGEKSRLNYQSLRSEDKWPRKNIQLNTNNGIMYAYASPIDRETGIIGDFGITIYFGEKQEIINHLIVCHEIVRQVFDYVEPGLTFSEIAQYMKGLITSHHLNNEIECKTSPSTADDVGHTIPFIMEDMTEQEQKILKRGDHDEIQKMISEKRIYIRASEDQIVKNGMAFTIEPRPRVMNNSNIPMVSFHSICAIHKNGTKELITNFDTIFNLIGMKYIK